MAMALPLVGALAGGFGAYALGYTSLTAIMMGASIGWMVGSWGMMSMMDLGNNPIDTGANEAPRFNTAVRGQAIPVLFGTNRVPGQINWQSNFEAIRSEDSGDSGGKMGGSGGGKAPKTGSGGASYTYKMDAIYHLGFVPEPVALLSGWLGGDKITDASITSISIGSANGYTSLASQDDDKNTAGISYDEGVFFNGDIDETNDWAHFTSEVGHPIVWPGTCWVGFAGLDLGSMASLPQLNFEVGPNGSAMTASTDPIWATDPAGNVDSSLNSLRAIDANGNTYYAHSATEFAVYDIDGNLMWVETNTKFASDFSALGLLGVDDVTPPANITCADIKAIEGGTKLAICITIQGRIAMAIASLPVSGDTGFNFIGWCYLEAGITFWYACRIHEWHDITGQCSALGMESWDYGGADTWIHMFPAAAEIELGRASLYIGGHPTSSATFMQDECARVYFRVADAYGNYLLPDAGGKGRASPSVNGWSITNINPLTFGTTYRVYYRRGKDFMADVAGGGVLDSQFSVDHYLTDPNGAAFYVEITDTVETHNFGGLNNKAILHDQIPGNMATDQFVNRSGVAKWFDGEGAVRILDGGTYDGLYSGIYYGATPWVQYLAPGTYLTLWAMADDSLTYYTMFGKGVVYARLRAYLYYSTSDTYIHIGDVDGPVLSQGDLGKTFSASANRIRIGDVTPVRYGNKLYIAGEDTSAYDWMSQIGTINLSGADCTPPYIIRQILVNEVFGLDPGGSVIDETSYATAVSYCEGNNIYVSTQYRRDGPALDTIEMLLALYGGWLTVMPAENKVKFGIMELQNNPVRTIDNHHLLIRKEGDPPITTTKGAPQDTNNLIRVNYLDRSNSYQINQVEDRDEIDEDLTGTRIREFPPDFVMERSLAQWLATRTLWSNLYTRDAYKFYLGWKDSDLEPGDIVTLVDSFDDINVLAQLVSWKEVERGVYEVTAAQQLPYIAGTPSSSVSSAMWDAISRGGTDVASLGYLVSSGTISTSGITINPSLPSSFSILSALPAPVYQAAYELPQEFQINDTGMVYVGWRADAFAAGAKLYVSADGVSYAPALNVSPYPYAGKLLSALPAGDQQFAEGVEFILHPSTSWSANTPTYAQNVSLNDVDLSAMHNGLGLIWCGSEMLAFTGLTLLAQNRYRARRMYRGWGGTAKHAHSSGDNFHKHAGGVFAKEYSQDQIGTTFYYKVVPYNLSGYEYPVSSVSANQYTIQGQHYRPQNATNLQFRGNRGITKLNVGSDCDIDLTWQDSARKSGFGSGGYGTAPGGFGGFTTDTLSHYWAVSIVGSGGSVVRSTTTTTPAYTYTNSQNASDNGAWYGKPSMSIRPMSPYGPSTRVSVISLDLFF